MSYLINKWALIRRGELSVTPEVIEIHSDFLHTLSHEDFETAFRQVGDMFYKIMTDISESPERFAMPLYDEATTRYGAPEAQESRFAAWRPIWLLNAIFANGNLNNQIFSVDIPAFKQANKIKNVHLLFKALRDYGFEFSGLTNGKITPKTVSLTVEYPDNPTVISVLFLVTNKAADVGVDYKARGPGWRDFFCRWSFRLLVDGFGKFNYDDPFYPLYDKTRTEDEQNFIQLFHQSMNDKGYCYGNGSWNEGPGICYYDKESVMKRKGPYLFRILDWMGDLRLMLRIRNAENCIELYDGNDAPQEIIEMFRHSDPGCGAHANGNCGKGVGYNFEGQSRWHCGCCSAPFWLHPRAENISDYIRLVETGERR